jgi:hypothetical protein
MGKTVRQVVRRFDDDYTGNQTKKKSKIKEHRAARRAEKRVFLLSSSKD